jgi:hypothetical protein
MADLCNLDDIIQLADGRVAVCECPRCGHPIILPRVLEVMTLDELKQEFPLVEEETGGEGQGLASDTGGPAAENQNP